MINFKLPRRQFDQGLSPWRNKSNSSDASPQKKNVLSNRRKGCPILNIINRQNLSNPYCTLQRQSISNLIRPRYTSSVNQKSLVQTLNLRKRPESKQILQELPVVNFVIQGGEQSAEKSTRREKFKSSFMVKHRLSLIRKDCIDQEKKPRIVRS